MWDKALSAFGDQGIFLGMAYRVHCQVDVDFGPIKVIRPRQLDIQYRGDRRVAKPRKLAERDKQLLSAEENPESTPRDVRYFSRQSVLAKRS